MIPSHSPSSTVSKRPNAKSIAQDIFKNLKASGYISKDIVLVSTELLSQLTQDLQESRENKRLS